MIIDTHCHLIDEAFNTETDIIIKHAIENGVGKMIVACCEIPEFAQIKKLCDKYPGNLFPTIGIHPENLQDDIQHQISAFEKILNEEKDSVVAIGEIGLDLYWDKSRIEDQKKVLLRQLELAAENDIPVLLHIREAMPEFLTILHSSPTTHHHLRGILHCYSGTIEQAEETMSMGDFLLGIGGTVTYKKSDRIDVVKHFGLDKIVLETDSPYLAPVPHRGKRNEPAYTADVARFIAEKLAVTYEDVCEKTTRNAEKMFKLQ